MPARVACVASLCAVFVRHSRTREAGLTRCADRAQPHPRLRLPPATAKGGRRSLGSSCFSKRSVHHRLPRDFFAEQLRDSHTSFLRLNYYPPCDDLGPPGGPPPLGISPHKDAGFLTILAQERTVPPAPAAAALPPPPTHAPAWPDRTSAATPSKYGGVPTTSG